MSTTRTMTCSQMNWNLKKGFAWYELDANGQPNDDWCDTIWTKDGGWLWDTMGQVYEMLL